MPQRVVRMERVWGEGGEYEIKKRWEGEAQVR